MKQLPAVHLNISELADTSKYTVTGQPKLEVAKVDDDCRGWFTWTAP